jgi:predicted RNase H-like HicB family nuclease
MVTSGKSKSSRPDPRRPFDPRILRQARQIAKSYEVVVWQEEGYYYGHGVELPTSFGGGKTVEACVKDTREAFVLTVAVLLEEGKAPPPPAREEMRTEQVNVRLTAREKLQLEAAAKQKGFRGVSDYVRSAALAERP